MARRRCPAAGWTFNRNSCRADYQRNHHNSCRYCYRRCHRQVGRAAAGWRSDGRRQRKLVCIFWQRWQTANAYQSTQSVGLCEICIRKVAFDFAVPRRTDNAKSLPQNALRWRRWSEHASERNRQEISKWSANFLNVVLQRGNFQRVPSVSSQDTHDQSHVTRNRQGNHLLSCSFRLIFFNKFPWCTQTRLDFSLLHLFLKISCYCFLNRRLIYRIYLITNFFASKHFPNQLSCAWKKTSKL